MAGSSDGDDSTRAEAQRDRQDRIRDRVIADGFVRTDELATHFGVSIMTVHRALDSLQAQGWLRKVRGGATALPSAVFHGSVGQRMASMSDAKGRLAQAALDLIIPGQSVMLDESTTCLRLAQRHSQSSPTSSP